jgi:AraC family transcriptional regulator of adaptative response/methylated-DNA-[protein]-cysteine methyltransferase
VTSTFAATPRSFDQLRHIDVAIDDLIRREFTSKRRGARPAVDKHPAVMQGIDSIPMASRPTNARARRVETDPRWASVKARDRSADGTFVYAVATTGVYCRPSCGARLPRPENVRFFADGTEAVRAGFRPCKRCKADAPPLAERQAEQVAAMCRMIESREDVPSLDELAQSIGASRFHAQRMFKRITGVTPRQYAAEHRGRRVRDELRTSASVTEAIYAAGFESSARFYEQSNALLGMAPQTYRKGGEAQAIRFAVGQCSLGAILVAATERGVCSIQLGDDPQALIDALARSFPRAELVGGDAAFERWVAQVVALVEAPRVGLTLPLDIRGTAFQQRVWRALAKIPVGATITYAALADAIGAPRSVRAVAQACASNPLAVAIPCHRVVRKGGADTGYRWGIERKRELLAREAK